MKTLTKHGICLMVCALSLYLCFVQGRSSGSQISRKQKEIKKNQPDIVLLGNSILRAAVDEEQLAQHRHESVLKVFSNGSASAWWYLYLKNVLCQNSHHPKAAILFFRDHFLTDPCFRVDGKYCTSIRSLADGKEPLMAKLFSTHGDLHSKRQNDYWGSPWTWAPQEAKDRLDTRIIKVCADLLGVNKHQQRAAMREVFDDEKMIASAITKSQLFAEEIQSLSDYDFAKCLPASFLPDMIRQLQDANIQPIFVRMKRRRDNTPGASPEALHRYSEQLTIFMESQGAYFIDFTEDPRIQEEHFGAGDHLNRAAKPLFTQMLCEALDEIWPHADSS